MDAVIDIAIWSFIIYRISTDIAFMDGPADAFSIIRGWMIVYAPDWVARGISCPICISFWLCCILIVVTGDWYLFAVAGVVTYLVRSE